MTFLLRHIGIMQLLQTGIFLLCMPFAGMAQSEPDTLIKQIIVDSATYNFNDQEPVVEETEVTVSDDYNPDTSIIDNRLPDTIIFRSVPDTIPARLKAEEEFRYANDPEYWIKKERKQSKGFGTFLEWLFSSPAVRALMYIILGAVLIFVIYKIIVNNSLFYTSSKKALNKTDAHADEIEDENLDEKVQAAIVAKDYRKAVRYLYFKSLRQLDQKGWIRYHAQATNYDYINQVSRYPVAQDFNFLTQVYEYVWYGGFDLTEEQFGIVHSNFQKMNKAI